MDKSLRAMFIAASQQASAPANLERELIALPELAKFGLVGNIWVTASRASGRDDFEESSRIKKGRNKGDTDLSNFRARLAVRCLVDDDRERILEDDDAFILGELPVKVLNRIMAAINRLDGVTEEEKEALGNASASGAASVEPSSISPTNSGSTTSTAS